MGYQQRLWLVWLKLPSWRKYRLAEIQPTRRAAKEARELYKKNGKVRLEWRRGILVGLLSRKVLPHIYTVPLSLKSRSGERF